MGFWDDDGKPWVSIHIERTRTIHIPDEEAVRLINKGKERKLLASKKADAIDTDYELLG